VAKPKGKTKDWVRTGGFIGDDTMERMDEFNSKGAGVDSSKVKHVGGQQDPNEGVSLLKTKMPGAER
jgi:hypothetical protein